MISSNLLNLALQAIGSETVVYQRFNNKAVNDVGVDIPTFDPDITLKGSFQPVPANLYAQNGLDFNKKYFTFYSSNLFVEINRDLSSDRILYAGYTHQVLDSVEWFEYNGWEGVLCVRI